MLTPDAAEPGCVVLNPRVAPRAGLSVDRRALSIYGHDLQLASGQHRIASGMHERTPVADAADSRPSAVRFSREARAVNVVIHSRFCSSAADACDVITERSESVTRGASSSDRRISGRQVSASIDRRSLRPVVLLAGITGYGRLLAAISGRVPRWICAG
jgi:hypothetical protein